MKYTLFLLPILLWQTNDTEPTVQNVQFRQSGQQVIITYDIVNAQDWQTFDVEVFYSGNGGYSYGKALQAVEGDVGYDIKGGYNKRIVWRVLDERPDGVVGNRIKFKVEATIKGTPPIPDNMVYVEGGTFQMGDLFGDGSSDEKPVHTVTVSSFYMSKYEVSFAEYDAFCDATGRKKPNDQGWGRGIRPVINVSWYDAKAYCNWKTQTTGKKHRLPTEAEWEYAAREGGKKVRFGNGKNIADPDEINFDGSASYKKSYSRKGVYRLKTMPVNSFSPNALGLYNMSGNVWEWCEDWYDSDYYANSLSSNPINNKAASSRVIRGGSWSYSPNYCRAASRSHNTPVNRGYSLGFRIVVPFHDSNRD